MSTTRTGRTPIENTTWTPRPRMTKWLDYLFGNNQGVSATVQDENGEDISIFADSGYEEVSAGTIRTQRTPI